MRFDVAGKAVLEHIYSQADPRAYFRTLRALDYQIPQLAKPYFRALIDEIRIARGGATIVDIGCSYGINAALLSRDLSMDVLYERYGPLDPALDSAQVLSLDRAAFGSLPRLPHVRFVGLDISAEALSYALSAGLLDDGVHADLEHDEPKAEQRERLAADLVVSTGCIGYVGERTIRRAIGDNRPWIANTVLRMYGYEAIEHCLAELGYETTSPKRLFRQRRFASTQERLLVLRTLAELGIDTRGYEDDGWLYARLFISRPCPAGKGDR
jgi:carnitine O-acetyltransferase